MKKNLLKRLSILLAFMSILIMPVVASASPAKSVYSFNSYSYGYNSQDSNGGSGWYANTIGTISKENLKGLWYVTTQEGYGQIRSVKIDGVSVDFNLKIVAGSMNGNEVTGWITSIKITDSDYISNLTSGTHTISATCTTSNTYPSRTLSSFITFKVS